MSFETIEPCLLGHILSFLGYNEPIAFQPTCHALLFEWIEREYYRVLRNDDFWYVAHFVEPYLDENHYYGWTTYDANYFSDSS